jgi:hypothetical protein
MNYEQAFLDTVTPEYPWRAPLGDRPYIAVFKEEYDLEPILELIEGTQLLINDECIVVNISDFEFADRALISIHHFIKTKS